MKRHLTAIALAAVLPVAVLHASPEDAPDVVDEIHYSYGDTTDSVVVNWRGEETTISYGPTRDLGFSAVAGSSAITPVDIAGPFREVVLTGLAPDITYHYRIGADGADHTLRAAPAGSFRFVDVGDTAATVCKPWVADVHALIARLSPRFVTHGGDISEANVCGVAAVHRYYVDQQAWSTSAAFQPVWGNHEYGYPTSGAPAGTPRDSLANYKGRGRITHPYAVPLDDATRTTPPGCAGADGNGCPGEDWGWFRAGGVLFVSYPEIWAGSLESWRATAEDLMADAQDDPSVDFVVTYGHRPAYSSLTVNGWDPTIRAAVDALATAYSPRADNPDGKYVLNLAHHVHALEVFRPVNGLTHVTNATGGQGVVRVPSPPDPNSLLRFSHLGVLSGDYEAPQHRLTLRWICGPAHPPGDKDVCASGDTVWSTSFTAGRLPDPGPAPSASATTGPTASPGPSPSPSPTASPTASPGGTPSVPVTPTGVPPVTTPPPTAVPPGTRQWVANPGLESNLTGWAGRYGSSPFVSVTRATGDAHGGRAAIRVAAGPGARDLTSGFNDDPKWVRSTTAGRAFTASAWIRAKAVGQDVVVRLREWTSAGALVADELNTWRATTTAWKQVSAQLTTARSGGSLSPAVYAKDLDAGEWFLADDLSLTSR